MTWWTIAYFAIGIIIGVLMHRYIRMYVKWEGEIIDASIKRQRIDYALAQTQAILLWPFVLTTLGIMVSIRAIRRRLQ